MRLDILAAIFLLAAASSCSNRKNGGEATESVKDTAFTAAEANTAPSIKPQELTTDQFVEKVARLGMDADWKYLGDKPAVIDFYATWCGPCKQLAPTMDELAAEYAGQVVFYKIDIDKEPDLASAFNVQSIPTLLFIPLKGDPGTTVGLLSKEGLKSNIDKLLGK